MSSRDHKKFDPALAPLLDAPERERYLPAATLVELLELSGSETVVDYGAGTGRVSLALAAASPAVRVIAVDENDVMIATLSERLAHERNAGPLAIADNHVPIGDGEVDRVLAVNVLHEVRGESALAEMRRLLAAGGFALVVDWERGRRRDVGPPDALLYTEAEASAELERHGFTVERAEAELPFHFVLRALRS